MTCPTCGSDLSTGEAYVAAFDKVIGIGSRLDPNVKKNSAFGALRRVACPDFARSVDFGFGRYAPVGSFNLSLLKESLGVVEEVGEVLGLEGVDVTLFLSPPGKGHTPPNSRVLGLSLRRRPEVRVSLAPTSRVPPKLGEFCSLRDHYQEEIGNE